MSEWLGHFNTDGSNSIVSKLFSTHEAAGGNVAPSSAFENSDIRIYKAPTDTALSATQRSSSAGVTMTSPFDSLTGFHLVSIDLTDNTDASFYVDGHYWIVLAPDETVDGETITGVVLARFTIGVPVANVTQFGGSAGTFASGVPAVNATQLSGDSTAADNAEAFFDGTGYAGTNNVIPTVTTLTGHTAQTGDVYALANGSAGFVAIDTVVDSILAAIGSPTNLGSGATISANTDDIFTLTNAMAGGLSLGDLATDLDLQALITTVGVAGAGLTEAGGTGDQLTALATASALSTAQSDLDTITGTDGVTLATTQANYAPATATALATAQSDLDIITGTSGVNLEDGSITAAKLAADCITAAKVAADVHQETIELAFTYNATADYAGSTAGSLVKEIADNAGGSSLTVGDIADAVWDEAQSEHTTAGTFGKYLDTEVSGVGGGSLTAADIADAVWDEATSGHTTSGTFGEQLKTDVDAILADTNELQTNQDNWLTANGFSTHSAADVWSVATRVLTAGTNIALAKGTGVTGFNDLDAAGIRSAVGLDTANLDTQLAALPTEAEIQAAITGGAYALDTDANGRIRIVDGTGAGELSLTSGLIDGIAGTIQTLDALDTAQDSQHSTTQSALTTIDSNVDAILLDTGELQADWANGGRLDLILDARASQTSVDDIPTNAELATALDDIPTAAENAAGLLDLSNSIETGLTLRNAMRLISAACAGKVSGAATTTVTIRNAVADSKDRATATVDADGNRTAITYDLT